MAHRHHAVHAPAGGALLMQSLAHGKPGDKIKQRDAGQGDDHIAAG